MCSRQARLPLLHWNVRRWTTRATRKGVERHKRTQLRCVGEEGRGGFVLLLTHRRSCGPGVLAGVGEALMSGKPQDAEYVIGFIAAFSLIAAYLFWCGKCRMRWSPALRKIHEIQDD